MSTQCRCSDIDPVSKRLIDIEDDRTGSFEVSGPVYSNCPSIELKIDFAPEMSDNYKVWSGEYRILLILIA